jgi:hypothetical protein
MKAVLTDVPFSDPNWVFAFRSACQHGKLREPRYEGLRDDKPARGVVREEPS